LFKVVPDQLRISEGWVRCGQCDEVFDASAHLVNEVPVAPEALQDQAPTAGPFVDMAQEDPQAITSQFLDLDLDFSEIESTESHLVNLDFGGAPGVLGSDADLHASEAGVESAATDVLSEPDIISPTDVSFLRSQSDKSAWHRPLVRIGLSALVLVLLLTLAGQFVVHERDRLAAHEPRLTPWLLDFCAPLGCSLSPVQRIESVVIDSSSFARIRGETYRLSFTLKNTSGMPLALPAVELTLTDALDQPVLRRVVLSAELGALPGTLGAGLALPVVVTFLVKLDAVSERMAGYRLLAFYP
jgi:predicted Zn finger-like uncharacterized protein